MFSCKYCTKTTSQFDLELDFMQRLSQLNFSNETIRGTGFDAFRDCISVLIVFEILGNVVVILSIMRQRSNALKNNYYTFLLCTYLPFFAILYLYEVVEFDLLDEHFLIIPP